MSGRPAKLKIHQPPNTKMSETIENEPTTESTGEYKGGIPLPSFPSSSWLKIGIDTAVASSQGYKNCEEAGAAGEQRKLRSATKKNVDPLAGKASSFLYSGTELNKTCIEGVRSLVDVYGDHLERTAHAAASISQNVTDASETATEAFYAVASSAEEVKETAKTLGEGISDLNKNINNVCIVANSMLTHTVHLLHEAVAELRMVNQNLKGIKDELGAQNTLTSSGGAGPDGFATASRSFISRSTRAAAKTVRISTCSSCGIPTIRGTGASKSCWGRSRCPPRFAPTRMMLTASAP